MTQEEYTVALNEFVQDLQTQGLDPKEMTAKAAEFRNANKPTEEVKEKGIVETDASAVPKNNQASNGEYTLEDGSTVSVEEFNKQKAKYEKYTSVAKPEETLTQDKYDMKYDQKGNYYTKPEGANDWIKLEQGSNSYSSVASRFGHTEYDLEKQKANSEMFSSIGSVISDEPEIVQDTQTIDQLVAEDTTGAFAVPVEQTIANKKRIEAIKKEMDSLSMLDPKAAELQGELNQIKDSTNPVTIAKKNAEQFQEQTSLTNDQTMQIREKALSFMQNTSTVETEYDTTYAKEVPTGKVTPNKDYALAEQKAKSQLAAQLELDDVNKLEDTPENQEKIKEIIRANYVSELESAGVENNVENWIEENRDAFGKSEIQNRKSLYQKINLLNIEGKEAKAGKVVTNSQNSIEEIRKAKQQLVKAKYQTQEEIDQANSLFEKLSSQEKKIIGVYNKEFDTLNDVLKGKEATIGRLDLLERNYSYTANFLTSGKMAGIDMAQGIEEVLFRVADAPNAFNFANNKMFNAMSPFIAMATAMTPSDEYKNKRKEINKSIDDYQSGITQGMAKPKSLNQLSTADDWGRYLATTIGSQIPNTAVLMTTGGAGLYLLGATSAGSSFKEMQEEMDANPSIQYSAPQMYGVAMLNGAAEIISERISLGIIKRGQDAFNLNSKIKKGFVDQVKSLFTLTGIKAVGMQAVDIAGESLSEGGVEFASNLFDRTILGKDVDLFEGVTDAMFSGLIMSAGVYKSPNLFQGVVNMTQSVDSNQKIKQNYDTIKKLEVSISPPNKMSKSNKAIIENKIAKLVKDSSNEINKGLQRFTTIPIDDIKKLSKIESNIFGIRQQMEDINSDPGLVEGKKDIIDGLKNDLLQEQINKKNIITPFIQAEIDAAVEGDVAFTEREAERAGRKTGDFGPNALGEGKAVEAFESTEEFQKVTGVKDANVDAFITDTGQIIINKQHMREAGAIGAGRHELLHKIIKSEFSIDPVKANKLKDDFLNDLEKNDKAAFDQVMKRAEAYTPEYLENNPDEYITLFSSAVSEGSIPYNKMNDGFFKKMGNFFSKMFGQVAGTDPSNISFENGKDVYNFVQDYIKNSKGKDGKLSDRAIKLADQGVDVVNKSKLSSTEIVAENKNLSNQLESAIETGDVQAQTDIKNDLFLNNQGVVGDFVKNKFQPNLGITKTEFSDAVNEEVLVRLNKTYNPSKGEYGAYIREALFGGGKFGGGRLGNILKSVGQEGDLFNKQIDDQKLGEITTEDAPIEISNDKSRKTKASKVLSPESITKATEQVKSRIKNIDPKDLTFKKLGSLTAEVTAETIGIPVEKLTNPKKNLSKPEANKAQRFIVKNIDNIRRTLPEGSVQEGATEGIIGTSTGVPPSLLKNPKIYTKQARGKKGAGLYAYRLNPNVTNADILEAAGIVDGKMKPGFKPRDGQAVKAIINVVDKNITNELVRTGTDISQTKKVDVGAGRSKTAFSITVSKVNDFIEDQSFIKNSSEFASEEKSWDPILDLALKGTGISRIDMKTDAGRKRFLEFAATKKIKGKTLVEMLPKSFWRSMQGTTENLIDSIENREFVRELAKDKNVGEIYSDESNRGYKGNLPFLNVPEADAWIESVESDGGKFAEESDMFSDMLKFENPRAAKMPLNKALNDPAFKKRQENSINGLKKVFEILETYMKDPEGIAFVGALMSSSGSSTNHFVRKSAPYKFYEKGFLTNKYTKEHTLPASIVGKYLFGQALAGTVNKNFGLIKKNYFQGALLDVSDKKLKGIKPDGNPFDYVKRTPEGWKLTDNIWARYFNLNVAGIEGGINPSNIVMANNESVFDKFNVTPSGLKIIPSQQKAYSKTKKLNSTISTDIDPNATPQQQVYELGKLDERATKEIKASLTTKQQAFDTIFNDIIESSTGIESYKDYSSARATTVGAKKGRFSFFTTPSAEDFVGLLYKTLGKGKVGDAQFQFYKDNLIDPYNKAEISVTKAKMAAANDYKALKRNLKTLPNSMSKPTGIGGFTYGQAARVAVWTRQGMEVPGMSKKDIKELNDFVEGNKEMDMFANELINIQKGKPYPPPSKEWLGGNITSDILNEINKVNRKQYLQEWQENIDAIFSDKNMNKLEAAYGPRYVEALRDQIARMKSGSNRPIGGSRIVNQLLDWLNNSVGAVMFLNTRSAVLQTLSAVNFINFGNNNIYKAGKAFANQPQFWSDFKTLMNSDYLTERRNGLKINVSESEIADAVAESSNKPKAAISYLLNKGFIFTRIADSFAIAVGGASFYRNTIDAYVKQGMDVKAAEKQAFNDFYAIAEESQQSSNPSKISQQQASAAGRVVLAFANTPMQYNRIIKRASQDLINKRGDWKANVSKIVYYAAVQNLIFNALQNALFAQAFGEDEDEDEKQANKEGRIANGMADSLLRGLGIQGAVVSALKNSLMTVANENDKKSPKFVKAVYDLFDFSPPLDSKFRKLRSGANTITWERENIKNKGFDLNNPAYLAGAQLVSGLTNLPLDRAIQKINNIRAIASNSSENWQKVAMALGWSTWDVGLPFYGVDDKVVMTPQMILKEKVTTMAKETSTKEQKQMLLDLGLTKQEIKALKYEDVRVKKIIELQKKK